MTSCVIEPPARAPPPQTGPRVTIVNAAPCRLGSERHRTRDTLAAIFDILWFNGKLFGIEWSAWKVVGWLGTAVFTARFVVQWHASEKRKQVVVPSLFWWLSIIGSLLLLAYALFYRRDSVMIAAYALNWIPYLRNLILHYRNKTTRKYCSEPSCGAPSPGVANYCASCGMKLP